METRVTSGWSRLTPTSRIRTLPGLLLPLPLTTESALFGIWSLISPARVPVAPVSAMLSMPGLEVAPISQKLARLLCTAPISGDQCAPPGKLVGWVEELQVALKSMR